MEMTAKELMNQIDVLFEQAAVLRQMVRETFPKRSYYDVVLENDAPVSMGVIAEDYGVEAEDMCEILRQMELITRKKDGWTPASWLIENGYAFAGTPKCRPEVGNIIAWTQKGRLYLYDQLRRYGIYPEIEEGEHCDGSE